MPRVDQFESVFKAAVKAPFEYRQLALERVVVVSDLDANAAQALADKAQAFTGLYGAQAQWTALDADATQTVEQLLNAISSASADLVVAYRNVHTRAWQWPHSLGRHLDILTQATDVPVLVLPHPLDTDVFDQAMAAPSTVMAVTSHLAGDSEIVNQAAAFLPESGKLLLAHVEDDATFDRYMETISKIPAIDTTIARATILAQLLKEPADYVEAVRAELSEARPGLSVSAVIESGHRVGQYRQLVAAHEAELLVLHTKDDGQDAMHGVAYSLGIELRSIPLLML